MKFLCDSCKAKYQIADEKVAGKTVRMKCRKCGHQIEVRAAVTETSVSSDPPRPPGAPRPPQRSGLATSLSAAKPRSIPSIAPGGALAGAFKSNVQDVPATVPGDSKSSAIELSVTDEWYVAINGVPVGPVRISELRRKAAAGAVTEDSLCWQEGLEEWRPIRSIPDLAALVREAAQGNRPSLIGTPLPEPVAQRSPSIPPAPPPQRSPSIPSAPLPQRSPSMPSAPRQPSVHRNSAPPPPAPPRPLAPSAPSAARSNVVPLRPAASSGVDDIGHGPMGGAVAAFAPSLTPAPPAPMFSSVPQPGAIPTPMAPIAPAADPFALPPAPPGTSPLTPPPGSPLAPPTTAAVSASPSFHPPPPGYVDPGGKKAGVPLWFWPILVLALGFGGGVAFIVFRPQPPPQPVVIQMPATATAQPTAEKVDPPPPAPTLEASAVASETKAKPVAAARPGAPKTAPAPEEKKGLDLGNLIPGGGGPNVGPNSGPGAGSGGGLDQAGVERVVAVHRNGVKRTCWERGGADQKSSVNVTVTANVAPNGTVASTSSNGDDPVVAKCIENQVKGWTFPAPGSSTTINIPFKFVRQ